VRWAAAGVPESDKQHAPVFWGFAIALVRFPDVLHSAGLDWLPRRGYRYSLWRQHPDTRQVQVLAASAHAPPALNDPVHYQINMPNGTWTLDVQPRDGWRNQRALPSTACWYWSSAACWAGWPGRW
jgi:hypothetical protein